jgi:hypothetical protein
MCSSSTSHMVIPWRSRLFSYLQDRCTWWCRETTMTLPQHARRGHGCQPVATRLGKWQLAKQSWYMPHACGPRHSWHGAKSMPLLDKIDSLGPASEAFRATLAPNFSILSSCKAVIIRGSALFSRLGMYESIFVLCVKNFVLGGRSRHNEHHN